MGSTEEVVSLPGADGMLAASLWTAEIADGTVLLLHGGGQTRHSWRTTGDRLARSGWTAYAPDARGHGDSAWSSTGDYSIDALVADLVAIVAGLESPPVLVGASMGGLTSLTAVGEGHVDARGLVLVDITPWSKPAGVKRILSFMAARPDGFASLEEVADAIAAYNPHRPRPATLDGLRKNVRRREDGRWYWHWDPAFLNIPDEPRRIASTERLERAAERVEIPTLAVRGRQSDLIDADDVARLQTVIPHAQASDVNAGHMIAGDDNDVFSARLLDFLQGVTA